MPPALPAGRAFTLTGRATYDFVPATYSPDFGSGALEFGSTTRPPIRGAAVEIRQCANVLGTATTDGSGSYTVTFTPGTSGRIFVVVLARTSIPPLRVQDNTDCDAVWAVGSPVEDATGTLDLHATHGWTGAGYDPSRRIAAPFAILDSMYEASHRLMDLPRDVAFPPLAVNWSPANRPSADYCPPAGAIVTSHYDPFAREISILGAAEIDTDEFDREVIVHEWSHYFEDTLSRSDSPGGHHGFGDVLDPRLSFGEGYASAFAAMLLDDRIYADTSWSGSTMDAFGWDVETPPSPTDDPRPGPFSELSVIRTMWDLYDAPSPGEPFDVASIGLGQIYDTLVGPERDTPALTTLASFVAGLKSQPSVGAAAVDAVLARCGGALRSGVCIGPISSEWGDGDPAIRAIYADVPAPSAIPFSRAATLNGGYAWNERPQNQYYVFTATATHATVTASSGQDVDLYAFGPAGLVAVDERPYGESSLATAAFATTPSETYVLVLTGWGGISSGVGGLGEYPATITFSN